MPIVNSDPAQTTGRMLQIESRQLLPNVLPTLSIGDIIQVTVRQNPSESQGLIYFRGLLVKAALPKNVGPGDKLLAKLTESNNNVVLKILEHEPVQLPAGMGSIAPEFLADIENLIQTTGTQGFRALRPFQFSDSLQKLSHFEQSLTKLFVGLGSPESLSNSSAALKQLLSSADGSIAEQLRDVARELRTIMASSTPPDARKSLTLIEKELAGLLEDAIAQSAQNNEAAATDIFRLVENFTDEVFRPDVRERLRSLPLDKENVRATMDRARAAIQLAWEKPGDASNRSEVQAALTQIRALLETLDENLKIPLQQGEELLQIASRFEQMAATQESLAKLNPVMQALGEPALILFPFLVQGLVAHSEVTIETQRRTNEADEENGGRGGTSRERFQRVQIAVPLPNLGTIDVDIAHRAEEIWVRFTVENNDVGAFLLEQLEHLAPLLRLQGYKKAELVTHVGQKQENLPAWTFGLHSTTSVVA